VQAGFEAQGFVSMFAKLQQANRINDSGAFPYLRSHPLTTERIADMQSRLEVAGRPAEPAPDLIQALAAARARLLAQPRMDALTAAVDEAQASGLNERPLHRHAAALYAGALASSRLREFKRAEPLLDRLQALLAPDPVAARWARLLAAENAIAAHDLVRARQLTDLHSARRAELLLAVQARLDPVHAGAAMQRLQVWLVEHPLDASAWQLLASASTLAGMPLRTLRAQAEVAVAHMDYTKALDTLRAAQDLVKKEPSGTPVDHIEASIIDARSREIGSMAREQLVER
jgi:predicted Zn-dependent protease